MLGTILKIIDPSGGFNNRPSYGDDRRSQSDNNDSGDSNDNPVKEDASDSKADEKPVEKIP